MKKLILELKYYGLNPKDWTIKLVKNNQAILSHKDLKAFKMKGFYKPTYSWSYLSLI